MVMAPFERFDDRSPTMILAPQRQDQPFFDYNPATQNLSSASQSAPYTPSLASTNVQTNGYFPPCATSSYVGMASSSTTPLTSNPSRKRSRDDSADDFTVGLDGSKPATILTPSAPTIPEEEPIYGEGMVLLNPKTGLALGASSSTGTWYEEKAAAEEAARAAAAASQQRPEYTSRKSQRLDLSAPGLDDIASLRATSPPKQAPTAEPTIDNFTLALGIGWTKPDIEDKDMEAAVRGWEKFIDNHYAHHLSGAKILVKSRGLNAYLVQANTGFFLFADDLNEGQLVGTTWERAVANLRVTPPSFEPGSILLKAERSPEPEAMVADTTMNGTSQPSNTTSHAHPTSAVTNTPASQPQTQSQTINGLSNKGWINEGMSLNEMAVGGDMEYNFEGSGGCGMPQARPVAATIATATTAVGSGMDLD